MTDPLIGVQELAERLEAREPIVLLDVRWSLAGSDPEGYRFGHIPGARFVDLDAELAGAPGAGGRHPLPAPAQFEAAMRRHGVSARSRVVAYDAASGAVGAARAWWLLRYMGHHDVRVLDGGLAAWMDADLPLTTEPPRAPPDADFVARPGAMPMLDAAGAAQLAATGTLIDVRSEVRYRGEQEPIDPVAGRIPGAVNAPAGRLTDAGGRWRAPRDLRASFEALGPGPYGAYCGSGVTAPQTVLALERAGLAGALYAGSWSEWITDRGRPVERDG